MNRLALALVTGVVSTTASAGTTTWSMDPAHSQIAFTVRHLGISNVRGEFQKFSGKVQLDEQDLTRSSVEVTIDAASVNTQNGTRDADLRSSNFFDVAKYPTLTFRSTRVEKAGDGFKVTGDLTMHGATRPVTLAVDELSPAIKDPMGAARRRALHATGELNRKEFGLTWSKAIETGPVVGDTVKLEINSEIVEAPASPAGQARGEDQAAKQKK